jgi:hypothetical protein
VKAIFEEVIPAIDIHKQIAARDLNEEIIDPAIAMFNNYDKNTPGDFFLSKFPFMGRPTLHWIRNC